MLLANYNTAERKVSLSREETIAWEDKSKRVEVEEFQYTSKSREIKLDNYKHFYKEVTKNAVISNHNKDRRRE
jgi:hypothetical protein